MVELLSPVGDFECLKAAVQNGANAVYFGANSFSARAFASNFDDDTLEKAINYAKIRGVKTNLTLNTLVKNSEITNAIEIAKKAYEFGIDAIIVQDFGLARYLIKNFPGLAIHASTQMSVHNLDGVLELQKLGFSRVVLSRELSLKEIKYICENSNIEIECFVHGALCISYSGQCLFSSIVGGRSGNRGKCAQPCRLPYELLEENPSINNKTEISSHSNPIDKGYLLSPRDLCGLDKLPELVDAGVTCLKIEGRMKSPEYVATVTRIYRKYLDLIEKSQESVYSNNCNTNKQFAVQDNKNFYIDEKDKQDLLQVFNRGGFSTGHLTKEPNCNLIFPQKPNNMGIFLGEISNFNKNKGYITFTTNSTLHIGDKISIEDRKNETELYTISELMLNDKNIIEAVKGNKITIGRMKGNISIGNKIYKMSDKSLTSSALATIDKELRKVNLSCELTVKRNLPICIKIYDDNDIIVNITSNIIPVEALKVPITKERLVSQLEKTNNTPFNFKNIKIVLDDGLYVPSISSINELRRMGLAEYEKKLVSSFKRKSNIEINKLDFSVNSGKTGLEIENIKTDEKKPNSYEISKDLSTKKISLLLNLLNMNFDYSKLKNIDRVYIPFKYFVLKEYSSIINTLTKNFDAYIYLPTIIRNNYNNLIDKILPHILDIYNLKGFVISNIGNFELLKSNQSAYDFICNYTFNVFNNLTINELPCNNITLSPELNKLDLQNLSFSNLKNLELIVYGRTPLMNTNYCLLGKSNKCYSSCKHYCNSSSKFFLKDRLGFLFRVIPDNIETVTTIYNSKITSIEHKDIAVSSVRVDILDEDIDEINYIIDIVKNGKKLEGDNYTNGNLNRYI